MRVVLDTNVLFAAYASRGLCEAVLEACLLSHEIVLSEHILEELRRKLPVTGAKREEIIATLREYATIVHPANVPKAACRDADDLPVLGTALAGKADCILTGDRDLLELGGFHGIQILTPRTFCDRLMRHS